MATTAFMVVSPVHPRERGEHAAQQQGGRADGGSSPRARGTQLFPAIDVMQERFIPASAGTPQVTLASIVEARFIPASAGNTSEQLAEPVSTAVHPRERGDTAGDAGVYRRGPVHPRERGEHLRTVGRTCKHCGSSPRARGTPERLAEALRGMRFIPASAGNTGVDRSHELVPVGSSPRARGTPGHELHRPRSSRFIPASAGNTTTSTTRGSRCTVHPRERGEHPGRATTPRSRSGSSPRARGTQHQAGGDCGGNRFIPASAGNTLDVRQEGALEAVHPRERGEHPSWWEHHDSNSGSSPRARGTLGRARVGQVPLRFIPASAGNTVHRVRGGGQRLGSSPRARGTLGHERAVAPRSRFIPASAGNTVREPPGAAARPVHPRERGEHVVTQFSPSTLYGSSPRARGTPVVNEVGVRNSRFIPASAGNTPNGTAA